MDHKVNCNICQIRIYDDYRYKCLVCDNYNLCSECFESEKTSHGHSIGHPVVRFNEPGCLFEKKVRDDREVTLANLEKQYAGTMHETKQCSMCNQNPILGLRFSNYNHKNHNLCSSCFKSKSNSKQFVVFGNSSLLRLLIDF